MNKVQRRRDEIVEMLKVTPVMTIADLAAGQGVTMETIRKDLKFLEKQGVITKIHGGAALAQKLITPFPFHVREDVDNAEKKKIASVACPLIGKGDSVLIEGSTTTLALCQELKKYPELMQTLTIITNSIHIAQSFEMGSLCKRLFFLGGWMYPTESATKGSYTQESMSHFSVDKAFLSGSALDNELNIIAYYEYDMFFQRVAIEHARQSIVLLNSSKYQAQGLFRVCSVSQIDCLITDSGLPNTVKKKIQSRVECIVV